MSVADCIMQGSTSIVTNGSYRRMHAFAPVARVTLIKCIEVLVTALLALCGCRQNVKVIACDVGRICMAHCSQGILEYSSLLNKHSAHVFHVRPSLKCIYEITYQFSVTMCSPMPFGVKSVCVCAASMPPARSRSRSRSPSPDEYPSHFEQIRRWRLHGNLRVHFWISMTWVDVAGVRQRHHQYFHTDEQTQLQVYTAAQRLLRREPRIIQIL